MKWFVVLLPFLFSVAQAQQTMTIGGSQGTTQMTAPSAGAGELNIEPNWEFRIGQTSLNVEDTGYHTVAGSGLTIGGRYNFNSMFAVGGEFTGFKLSETFKGDQENMTGITSSVLGASAEFTPITATSAAGGLTFNGTIVGGGLAGNSRAIPGGTTLFYGAALAVDYQKQIGVRLESKVASDVNSMTTLSVVGYY